MIYSQVNKSDKEVKIIYDKDEYDKIQNDLDVTDGIVEYTDDKSLGYGSDDFLATVGNSFGEGITRGHFQAYVYVGKETIIDDKGFYALSYAGAHEFLHQTLGKIGFIFYDNLNFYQPGEHYNDGGLLTDANHMDKYGGVNRPKSRGTGIEKISNFTKSLFT